MHRVGDTVGGVGPYTALEETVVPRVGGNWDLGRVSGPGKLGGSGLFELDEVVGDRSLLFGGPAELDLLQVQKD